MSEMRRHFGANMVGRDVLFHGEAAQKVQRQMQRMFGLRTVIMKDDIARARARCMRPRGIRRAAREGAWENFRKKTKITSENCLT